MKNLTITSNDLVLLMKDKKDLTTIEKTNLYNAITNNDILPDSYTP